MMGCPNDLELQSYFDGELGPEKAKRIASHLLTCRKCNEKREDWAELTQILQKGYPDLRPMASRWTGADKLWKSSAAAVAMVIVLAGFSTIWYLGTFNSFRERPQASRAAELLEQYFILYQEVTESDGGNDV